MHAVTLTPALHAHAPNAHIITVIIVITATTVQVRNNLVLDTDGAGVAFYSARDATVVQNTFVGVATHMQVGGGVLAARDGWR